MRKYEQAEWTDGEDEVSPVTDLVTRASDAYASSQADLARALVMQPLALTQWRGAKRTPSPATIRRMAKEMLRKSEELKYFAVKLDALAAAEATSRKRRSKKKV